MSKKLPYFKFYHNEWLNDDISFESFEAKGVFIDFCAWYWFRDCEISYELASKRFAIAKQVLDRLISANLIKKNASGLLEVKFLDILHEECTGISKKRRKAGKMGGLAKAANAKQKLSKCLPNAKQKPIYKDRDKDRDKDTVFSFDLFWSLYGKKVGKDKALKSYNKTTEADREKIKRTLPAYVQSTPDLKYRMHPTTYLNGRHWEDEIDQQPKNRGFSV